MKKNGFTLLEVLIAVTIMAFLSLYTAESIKTGVQTKIKIQKKIDQQSAILDALAIIAKDIQMAFNYRDINILTYNNAQKDRQKRDATAASKKNNKGSNPNSKDDSQNGSEPNANNTPAAIDPKKYKLKEEVILTQFIGSENELHFTSLSNLRKRKNDQTSDQAEVGYFLKTCRGRLDKKQSSNCLWRRISPYIDDEVAKGGTEIVLLENVEEFRLRYIGPEKEKEWVKNWKTDESGDDLTKGKFPYAVEITIAIVDPQNKKSKLTMTSVAPIRFSNNLELFNNQENENGNSNESQDSGGQDESSS